MSDSNTHPDLLRDASAALAYQRWLALNGLDDDAANAWRFVAESRQPPETTKAREHATTRWWIVALSIMAASLARATLVVVGLATAHTWTKVVEPEVSHKEALGNGTWGVTVGTRAICYTGQPYSDCVNAYVDQYNSACVGRELVGNSQLTCDRAYDTIQSMKVTAATSPDTTVADGSEGRGELLAREKTEIVEIVDSPEVTREATCYYGLIGECP